MLVPEDSLARRVVSFLGTPLMWWFLFWNWILFRVVRLGGWAGEMLVASLLPARAAARKSFEAAWLPRYRGGLLRQ
jgi:hypothetical protein